MLVFNPPQAPCRFFSSSTSSSLLSSPPNPHWTPDLFLPPASHLAWKTRPAPSHTLLICLTPLAMWLLSLFSCVCLCVRVSLFSHSLVFFSSACCYSPSSVPSICHGTSAPCLCLLVGQCQGVRRGQQQGMGMMGGVLIALTA